MAPVNFGIAEENRFLNGDFVSEKIKILSQCFRCKLEIAPLNLILYGCLGKSGTSWPKMSLKCTELCIFSQFLIVQEIKSEDKEIFFDSKSASTISKSATRGHKVSQNRVWQGSGKMQITTILALIYTHLKRPNLTPSIQ